jgi:4-hydroxythreonine-4-phosphate dehydrogenase
MSLPLLGITLGDAAGVGPEIIAKMLLKHPEVRKICIPVVIGDKDALRNGAAVGGFDPNTVRTIEDPSEAVNDPGVIDVIQTGPSLAHVPPGSLHIDAGDGAYRFVVAACELAKAGKIDGIVTPPLNKAALHLAGHYYPGHTELLAKQFGVKDYSLVLSAGDLYVFHLTTHVSMRQAIDRITPERVASVIDLVAALCRALGKPDEPIALAGLNPHAGENRLFGDEEADILAPAVAAARKRGIDAHGPLPGDAVIPAAVRGKWNMIIVCYHDQGHAPFKAVYGDDGVNITVGLPIVRVSVDHGTAFDIAGRGIAREASLVLATQRAAALAKGWGTVWETARAGKVS